MWDGDPVSLHPHPPVESAKRYVDLIGADAILAEGRRAFDDGRLPMGRRDPAQARVRRPRQPGRADLQADAYEQMGYQAEGPQWRGIFLTAARELREESLTATFATASPDTILAMPIDILFDYAAVHIDRRAGRRQPTSRSTSPSPTSTRRGRCGCAAASSTPAGAPHPTPVLTVSGPKAALVGALLIPANADELAAAGQLTLQGDGSAMAKLAAMYDEFDPNFNMVTP